MAVPALFQAGCLALPMIRSGPSQAWIEGVRAEGRNLVKGRVPYLIFPSISRRAKETLVYGAVVTVESRDGVHVVKVHNDSPIEAWIRTFGDKGIPVRAVVCQEGKAFPLTLPHAMQPGDERMLLVPDRGKTQNIRMRLGTYVDRDDIDIKFGPGPPLVAGFVIIPFSNYSYEPLPSACLDAVRALPR
jgi:hypothetical protein